MSTNAQIDSCRCAANLAPTICIISSTFVHRARSWLTDARNSRLSAVRRCTVTSRETASRRCGFRLASRIGEIVTSHHLGSLRSVRKKPTKVPILPAAASATAAWAAWRSAPSQNSIHEVCKYGLASSMPSSSCPHRKDSRIPVRSSTLMQSELLSTMLQVNASLSRKASSTPWASTA